MEKYKTKQNLFQIKFFAVLFAVISAITWASAFPLIKIGFWAFQIGELDTGGKTLFAGIRFFLAGVLVLLIAKRMKHKVGTENGKNMGWLFLFAIVNTSLHYFFFYMGLSHSTGARSAIFDSLGTFFLIILACICFKEEHMTMKKVIGCALGFLGVLLIHFDGGLAGGQQITFAGEGMLILSAVCTAFGGVLTRVVTKKMDPLVATGAGLFIGGLLLIAAGMLMGGAITKVTPEGVVVLLLLVLVSAIGFSLYNQLICYNPVGQIAIFNSLIPIFGAVLSCLILGERFLIRYLFAGAMVTAGVYVINRQERK